MQQFVGQVTEDQNRSIRGLIARRWYCVRFSWILLCGPPLSTSLSPYKIHLKAPVVDFYGRFDVPMRCGHMQREAFSKFSSTRHFQDALYFLFLLESARNILILTL